MCLSSWPVRAFALCATTIAANCHAATSVASVSAAVIAPIAVSKSADLSFGSFASGTGGPVTVSTSGQRSAVNTILSNTNGAPAAARFEVSGDPLATYDVSIVSSTMLADGAAHTMVLLTCSDFTAASTTTGNVASGTLSGAGTQFIFVGGTLSVDAAQQAGSYSGSIAVTVEYN